MARASSEDIIVIEAEDFSVTAKRDLAVHIVTVDGTEAWLPLSQIDYNEKDGVLQLPRWLAEEKELS